MKYRFYFLLFFLGLSGLLIANQELPAPYSELTELLPYKPHGWYTNAVPMEEVLKKRNVKVVIELGSWLGNSTRHIAETLPEDGVVFAVDHWLGNPQSRINTPSLIPTLFEQFLSNIVHAGLAHKVIPLRMTTLEAVSYFRENGIVPDLVYVDASHEEKDVYNDICAYFPLVRGHGMILGTNGDMAMTCLLKKQLNDSRKRTSCE